MIADMRDVGEKLSFAGQVTHSLSFGSPFRVESTLPRQANTANLLPLLTKGLRSREYLLQRRRRYEKSLIVLSSVVRRFVGST
jgi:hypothetical protein